MGEMISIPIDEYKALQIAAHDLAELRAYDHAKLAIDRGDDELVPAEVARRLISGEAPLRVWRSYRRFTQVSLAEASGVNRVQIANIEKGSRTGSVTTMAKLASTLGVAIEDLL